MSILSGFQRASYRGAEFYVRSSNKTNLGRKTVSHEYVNAGRYVEDLGTKLGIFTIEAEIMDTTWSAYSRKKKKLEEALNTTGIGTLIHPTYGRQNVVVTESNVVAENYIDNLGCAKYNLTFYVSDPNIFPTSTAGNKNLINRLFDKIFGDNETIFADAVNFYNQGIDVFNDARDTIENITGTINDVVSTINGVADEVSSASP
jgi:prophage DNA circulation protein